MKIIIWKTTATGGVLKKKMFLKFSQNLQEKKPVPESLFLIKLQADDCNFIKKETDTDVFMWILRNFLRPTFCIEHLR